MYYRPPNSNSKHFWNMFRTWLIIKFLTTRIALFLGDFNIDISKCHNYSKYLSRSYRYHVIYTRVTNHSATLIDNIFCNINSLPESGVVLSDISDHYPIFTCVPCTQKSSEHPTTGSFRKVTSNNLANLKDDLSRVDWSEVYDTQTSYELFMRILTPYLDKHTPRVKI